MCIISYVYSYCSWQWTAITDVVATQDAWRGIGKVEGNFSSFQGIQYGMFITLQNRCITTYLYDIQPIFGDKQNS